MRPPRRERFSTTAHVIRALNDETYDQSILTQANLAKICGQLPKWITFPDKDRAPWLNRAARQWWPFLNRAISNSVVDAVEPILNKLVQGSPIFNLHFSKFTLGTEPLVFASVACVDDVPNEVGLDMEFKWVAKEPEVQLDVSLLGMVLPIAIDKLEAFGTVRIVFGPLCDWWPAFSDMQVAFIGKPNIDLDLRLIGGDITKFPVVERLLMNLIKNVLTKLMTWPNRLDLQITEDQGARCTARAGIVRVTVRRGANMSRGSALGGSVFSTKATPAVEIVAIDGEYGAPKTTRVTSSWRHSGEDPAWEETFEVFVRDARHTVLKMCVVDTDAIAAPSYGSVKRAMSMSSKGFGFRKKQGVERESDDDSADDDETDQRADAYNPAEVKVAGGKDTVKALRTDKQASSWKGEKALYKSNLSVMGRVKFEVGKLYDSPGITLQETVPLKNTKSVGGKLLSAFSSVKEEDMPKLTYACKFIPLDDDPELEEARAARLAGITAKDLKNPDGEKFDVEDFCGVLHCKLLRATNLVSRDANGFSDPFVRCSFGRQIHKSSVKYETLHPVWDETFDFIVGVDDVYDSRTIECQVWDRDPYGIREYMGKVRIDLNALLLRVKDLPPAAGQAYTKTLKINEEITEAASGRLEMEFQFYPAKGYAQGLSRSAIGSRRQRRSGNEAGGGNALTIDAGGGDGGTPETFGGLSPSHSLRSPASRRGMMALAEDFVEREGTLSMDATDGKMLDSEIKALRKEKRKVDRARAKKEGGGCCSCFGGKGKKGKGDGKSLRGKANGDSSGNDFLARIEEAAPDTPDTPADSVFQELPSPRPSEAEGDRL